MLIYRCIGFWECQVLCRALNSWMWHFLTKCTQSHIPQILFEDNSISWRRRQSTHHKSVIADQHRILNFFFASWLERKHCILWGSTWSMLATGGLASSDLLGITSSTIPARERLSYIGFKQHHDLFGIPLIIGIINQASAFVHSNHRIWALHARSNSTATCDQLRPKCS